MDIRLVNLAKNFGGKYGGFYAVNNLYLNIPSGKIVGLVGPSGCGKSVALQLIAGSELPTEGQIFFGELNVSSFPQERREVGLVSKSYPLNSNMNILKNLSLPLEKAKIGPKLSKDEILTRVSKYAKLLNVENYLERKPEQLSSGQRIRVAIARALVTEPKVLLLDDPLSDLHPRLKLSMRGEIKTLQRMLGITMVYVADDISETMAISDEIAVMKDGEIQQIGKPQEVYTKPKNLFVAGILDLLSLCVFEGKIENKVIYIGEEEVGRISADLEEWEVIVGVRPEGFEVCENGSLTIKVQSVEYMGRDIAVIGTNSSLKDETFRFIIDGDIKVEEGSIIKANIKPNKLFIFDKFSNERLN